jgi:hypothetical protein
VIPEDCRWAALSDLQGQELTRRYSAILDKPASDAHREEVLKQHFILRHPE